MWPRTPDGNAAPARGNPAAGAGAAAAGSGAAAATARLGAARGIKAAEAAPAPAPAPTPAPAPAAALADFASTTWNPPVLVGAAALERCVRRGGGGSPSGVSKMRTTGGLDIACRPPDELPPTTEPLTLSPDVLDLTCTGAGATVEPLVPLAHAVGLGGSPPPCPPGAGSAGVVGLGVVDPGHGVDTDATCANTDKCCADGVTASLARRWRRHMFLSTARTAVGTRELLP